MKQPKRPTLQQKKLINKAGMDWKEWNVENQSDDRLVLIRKRTGERKTIER